MATLKKDEPIASHLIAEKRGISEKFLLKVLKPLVSAQVLLSNKGPNGGYRLARPANDITILEIVEAVDGPIRGFAPLGQDEINGAINKRLDQICSQAADQVRRALGKIKITELSH